MLQWRPVEISLLLQHAAHSAANLHRNKPRPAASRDPQTAAGGKCLMVSWVIRYIWLSLLLELFNPGYLLKKFHGLFFFFSHSYEFQTFSSSIHKWAPLWSLNDKPNFRVLTQILNNTQVFEHFHRMCARKDVCFCCHFTCTPFPSMSQSFPWLLILICHVSWKQQESAPFRKHWLYPTTFASILN